MAADIHGESGLDGPSWAGELGELRVEPVADTPSTASPVGRFWELVLAAVGRLGGRA